MAVYSNEITSYQAYVPTSGISGIHIYNEGIYKGKCSFYEDGVNMSQNISSSGRVYLHYPASKFSWVLDILRNEKPVFYYLNTSSRFGYIGTSREAVGEEEG